MGKVDINLNLKNFPQYPPHLELKFQNLLTRTSTRKGRKRIKTANPLERIPSEPTGYNKNVGAGERKKKV